MCLDEIQASTLRLWNKPEHIKQFQQFQQFQQQPADGQTNRQTNQEVNTRKNIPLDI